MHERIIRDRTHQKSTGVLGEPGFLSPRARHYSNELEILALISISTLTAGALIGVGSGVTSVINDELKARRYVEN